MHFKFYCTVFHVLGYLTSTHLSSVFSVSLKSKIGMVIFLEYLCLGKNPLIEFRPKMPFYASVPPENYFSYGLGFWRCLNFSPQIPTESTDTVDSASDRPADDGQVQKC